MNTVTEQECNSDTVEGLMEEIVFWQMAFWCSVAIGVLMVIFLLAFHKVKMNEEKIKMRKQYVQLTGIRPLLE